MKRLTDLARKIGDQGPNPAERIQGAGHRVQPPRHVGNFSDRKTAQRTRVTIRQAGASRKDG